jgi:FKBP-type peptidyl-prolyl cis-trans isomerase 2
MPNVITKSRRIYEDAPFPGLAEAVLGKTPGAEGSVILPPEKAFGEVRESNTRKLSRFLGFSKTAELPLKDFKNSSGGVPAEVGREFSMKGIHYAKAKVKRIKGDQVEVDLFIPEGEDRFEESFGVVTAREDKDQIVTELTPKIGATIPWDRKSQAFISSVEGNHFFVSRGHALAGKTLRVEYEVISVTDGTEAANSELPWVEEDHDAGLALVKDEGKPGILVLHAEWCSWCKKLLGETMSDVRIKALKDEFVWMKIDSDKNKEIKSLYEQSGFPMIVFFNADGHVAKKHGGYMGVNALYSELKGLEMAQNQ